MLAKSGTIFTALAAALPGALACVAGNNMPQATETISNDAPIEVGPGEVFDGGMARYDRGAGACNEQEEGGNTPLLQLAVIGDQCDAILIDINRRPI